MGVGGSKGGINHKLEKHRKKQLSKRKPLFGKIIGNEHLEGENTNFVPQRHHPRASPPSIEAADPEHPLAGGVEPDTSSRSVGSSQESHLERVTTPDIPSAPSRYRESGEFQPNRNSSQDTLSRELALTSSPHYKSSEFLTGTEKDD